MRDAEAVSEKRADEPPGREGIAPPEYIQCLQRALSLRGESVSLAQLMGLSGEAFRLFFSGRDPGLGISVVGHNPLRAAAVAMGYESRIHFAKTPEEALKLLSEVLAAGRGPALLRDEKGWVVVEDFAGGGLGGSGAEAFRFWRPGAGAIDIAPEQVLANWRKQPGLLELGIPGYYFFALGEKVREGEKREMALGALRRAYRQMFRRSPVEGCFGGLAAYREMALVLGRRRRTVQRAHDLCKYALWRTLGHAHLKEARKAALLYLGEAQETFDEEEQKHLFRAMRFYRQTSKALEELPVLAEPVVALLEEPAGSLTAERRKARLVRRLWWERRKALRGIERLFRLEKMAAEELQRVVEVAERRGKIG